MVRGRIRGKKAEGWVAKTSRTEKGIKNLPSEEVRRKVA